MCIKCLPQHIQVCSIIQKPTDVATTTDLVKQYITSLEELRTTLNAELEENGEQDTVMAGTAVDNLYKAEALLPKMARERRIEPEHQEGWLATEVAARYAISF